ncbi:MAG: phosphoribosylglycinamide formyltransferase [Pseudomonadota bacterium]
MGKLKVGALISGRGTNLQALIDAAAQRGYPAELVLVLSNRPNARGLKRAEAAGIETAVVDHTDFGGDRPAFEAALTERLEAAGVELICQAGFMRIVTAGYVARWWNRVLNIHPSLLPAFPGLETHARALEAGVKLAGCTVHFVREAVDQGPIVGQAAVPVLPDDSAESLAARVLEAEHALYPRCLKLVAEGRVRIEGEQARLEPDAVDELAGGRLVVPR